MTTKTYDDLMKNYLSNLNGTFDTGEGTLAYIIGSCMAMELAQMYIDMQNVEDNAYADTASGDSLEKIAAFLGMERLGKTAAVVRMEGDTIFEVGDVFTNGETEYTIISKEDGYYLAECNEKGTVGNGYIGEVLPKDTVDFEKMAIVSVVACGEDEEDDESLRKRYKERVNCPVCTGNMAYYKDVVSSVSGVGAFKVVPVSDGVGTVKVIITDTDNEPASEDLIKYVKNVLDPEETSGQGYGLVPVGHSVTVETVEKVDIDIVVEMEPSTSQKGFDKYARSYIPAIFKQMNKSWDENEKMILWDRVIEDYYLGRGATDVNVISINGQPNRIILEANQILGDVTINGT